MRLVATILAAALAASAFVPLALAQDNKPPQVARYELMEKNGDAAELVGNMVKGEAPYDAQQAAEALETVIADTEMFVTLFPEGSETGHDTAALPIIWEDRDGFDEHAERAIKAAEAAKAATPEGLDALRPAFRALGNACQSCHERYRAES